MHGDTYFGVLSNAVRAETVTSSDSLLVWSTDASREHNRVHICTQDLHCGYRPRTLQVNCEQSTL